MDIKIEHKFAVVFYALIVLGLLVVCINPPEVFLAKRGGEFAGQWMLGLLAIGLVCLSLNLKKFMLISFLGSAVLAFFLKTESNADLVFPTATSSPKITVAHVNLSSLENDFDDLIKILQELEVDVISFQEVTPDWDFIFKRRLDSLYAYNQSMVRADFYGMAIYSRIPLFTKENLVIDGKPNLFVSLALGDHRPYIFSTYLLPPVSQKSSEASISNLLKISEKINEMDEPVISLGDFNMVFWSNEIRTYRQAAKLLNSRRKISLNTLDYQHLFYTKDFECTFFQELTGKRGVSIGIVGTYQFTSEFSIN